MKIYDVLAKRQLKKQSFESSFRQCAGEYFTFRRLKPFSVVFKQKLIYWLNWIVGLDVESSTDYRCGGRYVVIVSFTLWLWRETNVLSQGLSVMAYEAVTISGNIIRSNCMSSGTDRLSVW